MSADISADVFALVKYTVIHVLFFHGIRTHQLTCTTCLICIVQDVCVCNVLSMNAATAFDHRELLCIQVLVRVRSEATTSDGFLLILFIVTSRC